MSVDQSLPPLPLHAGRMEWAGLRFGKPGFTADQMRDYARAAILQERERAASLIPTSWLDPLMIGMKVPAGCPDIEALLQRVAAAIRAGACPPAERGWQPIETAPKHIEVLCWREDQGVFISQLTTPDAVVPEDELATAEFPDDFEEWFHEVWGWQEGSERPTHWMPLPAGPAQGESKHG